MGQTLCWNCRLDQPDGEDGLCQDCREAVADRKEWDQGGICCRCELDLVDGFCPNSMCIFHSYYQDEAPPGWDLPTEQERAQIKVLKGKESSQ